MHQRVGGLHEQMSRSDLSAFSGAVTLASRGGAVARLRQFAVGADAGLGVDAPEQAFIRMRDGRIGFGKDELCLPAQSRAEIGMFGVEAIRFLNG
jgi:hypothetical protein